MDREHVRERLVAILTSKEFGSLQVEESQLVEEVSLLNDVALDSLQLLEFIVAIENDFQFKIDTRRLNIDIFDRFGSVVDFVQRSAAAVPA